MDRGVAGDGNGAVDGWISGARQLVAVRARYDAEIREAATVYPTSTLIQPSSYSPVQLFARAWLQYYSAVPSSAVDLSRYRPDDRWAVRLTLRRAGCRASSPFVGSVVTVRPLEEVVVILNGRSPHRHCDRWLNVPAEADRDRIGRLRLTWKPLARIDVIID
jgi:hypothetical protein